MPKISTYITTCNALFFQSILEQTIRQATYFSDEIIVVDSEYTSDGTMELLDNLKYEYSNIIKIYKFKEDYNKQSTIAEKKTFALKKCTGDYCILQDDDECIHEQYADYIKTIPIISPDTIAFRFNTMHFYRSFYHYQTAPDWYQKKIYMVKNLQDLKHGKINGDIDNYLMLNKEFDLYMPMNYLQSPHIIDTSVTSYHYGWCRNDVTTLFKKYYQEIRWHGKDYWKEHEFPFKLEDPNNLSIFKGIHPKHMIPIIEREYKYNSRFIDIFTKK